VIEVAALRTTGFNPHPPVGAGATLSPPVQGASVRAFQSSPARGAGATRAEAVGEGFFKGVSILTRPWGRVQPLLPNGEVRDMGTFQSSPARGGGCNVYTPDAPRTPQRGFNPHPPVGAGATQSVSNHGVNDVNRRRFNPHPPVGAGATGVGRPELTPLERVSILTRPWGRVQQIRAAARFESASQFQSSPARGGGCNW